MKPAARGASRRCTRRCSGESTASLHGVSSLNTSSGTRRRRAHASARIVAGPYSQLTTQSGSTRAERSRHPNGRVTGLRPVRLRCQAGSSSLG